MGLGAGKAQEDAGVGHGLDEEVEVRGPRPGEGRGGVLLRLGDAQGLADAAEDLLGVGEVVAGGVAARGDDGHALVHEDRGVGHDADHGGVGGEPLLDERGGDAGGRADDEAVGSDVVGELVEEPAHVLRLDGEDERVGALGGVLVGDGFDAVPLGEFPGAFWAARGDQEVGGGPAGADHAAEEGLADLAGAEDRDCLGHCSAHLAVGFVPGAILPLGAPAGRRCPRGGTRGIVSVRGRARAAGGVRVCGGGGSRRRGRVRAGRRRRRPGRRGRRRR